MFKKGTIILTPFPFTDLAGEKVRPAVIISVDNSGADVIVSFISSKKIKRISKTDLVIKKDHKDFIGTGLKVSSTVKLGKIATLEKKVILGVLGNLSEQLTKELDKKLRIAFGF